MKTESLVAIRIKEMFDMLKCIGKYVIVRQIPIYDVDKRLVAFLQPLTESYEREIDGVLDSIAQWNGKTIDETREWLHTNYIKKDDAILFLISSMVDDKIVGHIGIKSVTIKELTIAEVSDIVEGEVSEVERMMECAIVSMLQWGFSKVLFHTIRVFIEKDSRNYMLFSKIGFRQMSSPDESNIVRMEYGIVTK